MIIPQCSPAANYQAHKQEIDYAVQQVMGSGWYILGREVEAFEKAFATWNDIDNCVSCANGTDALELIMRALGISHGDQVVTVANTAVATISAIERAGAQPVFVDINPETFTMYPVALEKLLAQNNNKIKAVIAVHLFGHPAAINEISIITEKYGKTLIEDCAQAHGATVDGRKVGTFGAAAAFSFYPTKNLGALGDGGAVITGSLELAEKMRAIRQYGWEQRYISSCAGINSRLDELQAAILRVKLKYLTEENRKRQLLAAVYDSSLAEIIEVKTPKVNSGCNHVYHQYVILAEERDRLQDFLKQNGIGTAVHYPEPVHHQPAYVRYAGSGLPQTEAVNCKLLSLPMFPELEVEAVRKVAQMIKKFYS
ncbi:MAG: DegT/DnrJ/EryC1/StrS family aminotransferase [Victivallaceae bacterium]